MGLWDRIGRSGRTAVVLAVGLAGGGAALAVASVPDSNGVVHACYVVATNGAPATTGTNLLRIIDPSANQTCATTSSLGGGPGTERALDWNTAGPAGPTGPTGVAGTPGTAGQTGSPGTTSTVAQGHTFTISGGQVITVGNAPGITLAPPAINTHGGIGEVVIGNGQSALTFGIVGLGLVNPGASAQSGGGGGAGKVAIHDISITKPVDKASPSLSLFCASGKHIPKVTIELRKAGKVYLSYHLDNVLISSYQTGGHGNGVPVESLTLNFAKLALQDSK